MPIPVIHLAAYRDPEFINSECGIGVTAEKSTHQTADVTCAVCKEMIKNWEVKGGREAKD